MNLIVVLVWRKYDSSKDEEEQEVDLADIIQIKASIIMIKLFGSINEDMKFILLKRKGNIWNIASISRK